MKPNDINSFINSREYHHAGDTRVCKGAASNAGVVRAGHARENETTFNVTPDSEVGTP